MTDADKSSNRKEYYLQTQANPLAMSCSRQPPPPPPSSRPTPLPPPAINPSTDPSQSPPPTPTNDILLQSFEWHTPSTSSHSHWTHLTHLLPSLVQNLGITHIWLPPGCKANDPSGNGNGYDIYDLWDLGEFDQKWRRETKWGSREELKGLIGACERYGMEVLWDAVLGHKTAGDEIDGGVSGDGVWAVEVDPNDRTVETCSPKRIHPWLKFNFAGRLADSSIKLTPSTFQWRAEHFSGVDWCDREKRNAIFKLISDPATHPRPNALQLPFPFPKKADAGMNRLACFTGKALGRESAPRPGKGWATDVDLENGNNNYLMFSSIDYSHPDVRADTLSWARWMIRDVAVGGFRLDAAQHISRAFMRDFISTAVAARRRRDGKDPFIVAEVWTGEVRKQVFWLDGVTPLPEPDHPGVVVRVFDTPLLNNFARISADVRSGNPNADLRTILSNPCSGPASSTTALASVRPRQAVTFVANHDTQAGQSMETTLAPDLKVLFYAFILLRKEGTPCVFWGDLYGTRGPRGTGPACQVADRETGRKTRSLIPSLCQARRMFAYGEQRDYFDAADCIGWTRAGCWDRPGCAVVLSLGPQGRRNMWIGQGKGCAWVDVLTGRRMRVGEDGWGCFEVCGRGAGVWVREGEKGVEKFFEEMR